MNRPRMQSCNMTRVIALSVLFITGLIGGGSVKVLAGT
jgi:hypothetical protein